MLRSMTYRWLSSFSQQPNRKTRRIQKHGVNSNMMVLEDRVVPAAFTPGDIVVYRVGDGTATNFVTSKTNAVFLDEYSPSGTLVQSIPLPTTASAGSNPLTQNTSSGAQGFLADSADGHYLYLAGYDAVPGTTISSSAPAAGQTIARVDANGVIDTSTVDTSSIGTASIIRTVSSNANGLSTNGGGIWLATSGGSVRYTTLGTDGPSTQLGTTVTNTRGIDIVNGQLYTSADTSTYRILTVGTGLPTTSGQTIANIPGPVTTNFGSFGPYEFYLCNVSGGTAPDTLYVASSDAGIVKFSLIGGTWTLRRRSPWQLD